MEDKGQELTLVTKLSTKRISLRQPLSQVYSKLNYNEFFDVSTLFGFISAEEDKIDFSNLPDQDFNVINSLLFLTALYTDFHINKESELVTDEKDYLKLIEHEANMKIYKEFSYKDFLSFRLNLTFIGGRPEKTLFFIEKVKLIVCDNAKNKIGILISPSQILWTKSEKLSIEKNKHDIKLNNYSYIYFNNSYCEKLLQPLIDHPRVRIGFMSGMAKKNLDRCTEGLQRTEKLKKVKIVTLDQELHTKLEGPDSKPTFIRDFDKILDRFGLDETQTVFIESEMEKNINVLLKGVPYRDLAIQLSVFDENYFGFSLEKQREIDRQIDHLAKFLLDLVENCVDDVRGYVIKNKSI